MMLRLRSDQERGEEEIRKQAALIGLSPDGIIVQELDSKITFWSQGAEKMYGWTREEATGEHAHKLLETKFPEPYEDIIAKLKKTGAWSGELIHKTKTGKQIIVQSWWQPKLDQHGEISELMESNVDITELNKTAIELRETRDYLENLLNYANAPVIVWDPQFRITLFNHAFEHLTGLNAKDMIEKRLEILFPEDKKEEAMAYIKRTLEGEYWETVEIPILDVDGNVKTVLWNSANIYDQTGNEIVATIAQGQDITLRKQMEKKLEEYSRHLEHLVEERTKQLKDSERLAAIGATAGMVGHDIRNPLQAIIGDIFLAKTDLSSLPECEEKASVHESLSEIEKNIEYINKIVADLQDFAKPLKPIAMETDLTHLINQVVSTYRIPENIQLSITIQNEVKKIIIDSAFLQRILSNLINNAIQAMPNGGKLTVEACSEGVNNVITVEDTGVGIPEQARSKLFTPLFTTKSKGQGFGLAVVKRITEALGGTVTFDSQLNKGTKFIIRFPKTPKGRQSAK
jgi:PAS domain S-box-containing protein